MRNVFKLNDGTIVFQNKSNNTPKRAVENLTNAFREFYKNNSGKIRQSVFEVKDQEHGTAWVYENGRNHFRHFNFNVLVERVFVKSLEGTKNV